MSEQKKINFLNWFNNDNVIDISKCIEPHFGLLKSEKMPAKKSLNDYEFDLINPKIKNKIPYEEIILCKMLISKLLYQISDIIVSETKFADPNMKMSDRKIICIPYCGYSTDTYLIEENLKKGYYVMPFIFNSNDLSKSVLHKFICAWNICYLATKYPNKIIYNFAYDTLLPKTNNKMFPYVNQITNSLFSINELYIPYIKEFQLPYTMNHTGLSYISEMRRIFNTCTSIIYRPDCKRPILNFPLIKYNKTEIEQQIDNNSMLLSETDNKPYEYYIPFFDDKTNTLYLYFSLNGTNDHVNRITVHMPDAVFINDFIYKTDSKLN